MKKIKHSLEIIDISKIDFIEQGERFDKKLLSYLYHDCFNNLDNIADMLFCSVYKIWNDMKYYKIKLRDKCRKTKSYYIDSLLTESVLKNKYCWSGENMKVDEIADYFGVNIYNVYSRIRKYDIEKYDISKKILEKLYYDDKKSIKKISLELGISMTIIFKKIREYGIETRGRGKSGKENSFYGQSHTTEVVNKLRELTKSRWENNPEVYENVCKSPNDDTKDKMSKSAIERIKKQGLTTSYNTDSIPIIEAYGNKYGYDLQHAENGGEVQFDRYFVDGRCEKNNVVVEYMEKHHNYSKEYDKNRRKNIIDMLGCKYVEIWYDGNIKEFNT